VLLRRILEATEIVEYLLGPFCFESVVSGVFSVVKSRARTILSCRSFSTPSIVSQKRMKARSVDS